jgi:hypothetical protein
MAFARFAFALALAVGLSGVAQACPGTPGFAVIHSALPRPLPEGVFIAEVEIDRTTLRSYWGRGIRARVRHVVQGDPRVTRIILRNEVTTSCDAPLANGATGLILGLPRGRRQGVLIVEPITAHANDGFRLPDGISVPLECRAKPCPIEVQP